MRTSASSSPGTAPNCKAWDSFERLPKLRKSCKATRRASWEQVHDALFAVHDEAELVPLSVREALIGGLGSMVEAPASVAGVPSPGAVRQDADREAGKRARLATESVAVVGRVVAQLARLPCLVRSQEREVVGGRSVESNEQSHREALGEIDILRDRELGGQLEYLNLSLGQGGAEQESGERVDDPSGCAHDQLSRLLLFVSGVCACRGHPWARGKPASDLPKAVLNATVQIDSKGTALRDLGGRERDLAAGGLGGLDG